MRTRTTVDEVYEFITGEGDARACADIPDTACHEVPGNFFLNAINGAITKLADQLASPGLVLPWMLDAFGAPAAVIGWLSPIRRSGALLPQLAISGQIREYPLRKFFWMIGGFGFALALLAMAGSGLLLSGTKAALAVVAFLAVGSMARGVSSVAFKDVLGKTIPRGRRGRLLSIRATAGGLLALGAGLALKSVIAGEDDLRVYIGLVAVAGFCWFAATALVLFIEEIPGATEGGRNALEEARAGLHILSRVPGFRQFIIARVFLTSVELSLPYYALFGRQVTSQSAGDLGVFVTAASLAQVLSNPLWGRFADKTSRKVMAFSGLIAAVAGGLALAIGLGPDSLHSSFVYSVPLMIVGFAIAGVRLGRKTYLIDGAPAEDRPLYAAISNTILGLVMLAGGSLGFLADAIGVSSLMFILAVAALIGAGISFRLPEAIELSQP
jgi:hypothetical protein